MLNFYSTARARWATHPLARPLAALGLLLATTGATQAQTTNNALAFDGSDDYVVLPASTPVPVGNSAYTIEAWIKPTSMGVYGIVGWGTYGTSNQVNALRLSPTGIINYWWGHDLIVNTPDLSGQWHHVAATFDGTTRTIYLDGVAKDSDTPGAHTVPNANNLRIGSTNSANGGNGEYFPGSIDEVRIYSVGLTQAQVQADMYSTKAAVPASQVAYYNFDQGTAGGNNVGLTSLTDQSSNNSTGTLTNFALTSTSSNWVRSFPTITGIAPATGNIGTSVAITGTNLTDATGFAFNGTSTTGFVTPGSDLAATVPVPNGATTGPVSVASATLTNYNGPTFTVTYPDLVVTTTTTIPAGTYNSIIVNSPGVATLGGSVTVNTSTTINSGASFNDGCNVFNGAGSFTLAAGGTLYICNAAGISVSGPTGAIQNTGTRSFASDASYVYNGTAAQSTGNGLPGQVRNLTTTNANTVTLAAPTSVAQVVTVGAAGNLVLNGNSLTLLSTSAGTALVVNAGAGLVSGNTAVVQRYIDGSLNSGPGYRHFSVPVTGTTLADFTTSGFTPVVNSAYNSSPTPDAVTPFPTLYTYNQSALASRTNNLSAFDKGWLSPSNLTNGAIPGIGYCVNISAGQVVDFMGTLYNTTLTVGMSRTTGATAANGGWQLIGNPYPAPLDLSRVLPADRQNLDAAAYVVQSTGQYAGSYRAYVNGVSTSATNSPLLALGQGFFVRVSAGQTSGSFTFRAAQRVTSFANQAAFQRTAADPRPAVRLELAGAGLADSWVAYVEPGATPAFDSQFDAGKLPNSTGLNLSSATAGENLAIDGRAAFTPATVLALNVGVPAAGTYTLSAASLANLPTGLNAYLRDAATGQTLKLREGTSYSFSVTAAEAVSLLTGRFTLQFDGAAPLATAPSLSAAVVVVYPNPAHGRFTVLVPAVAAASQVQAQLLNTLGQVVRTQTAALPAAGTTLAVETAGLASGVYTLRLVAGASTLAKRVVIQ
jgi:hypothetical protein